MSAGYGWRPDPPDWRDRRYNLERKVERASALPARFSLRSKMPGVYDQGQLGSCTGNAIAGALEGVQMREGHPSVTPSRLFIYYGERAREGTIPYDSGASIRDGIRVVAGEGAPPETLWPYDISRFAVKPPAAAYAAAKEHEAIEYLRVEAGGPGSPIRTPVSHGLPVVFGFTVPEKFEDGTWDPANEYLPLPGPREPNIGGHAVCVVGWDFTLTRFPVNVFEIRNSWSSGWGSGGYFFMDARWCYQPQLGLSADFWTIEKAT